MNSIVTERVNIKKNCPNITTPEASSTGTSEQYIQAMQPYDS
jgi:hypothetical protein